MDTPGAAPASDRPASAAAPGWLWDVFCRVVDNLGDVGVCWRLARALALHGQRVRLWIDEPGALTWMAPHGAPGVQWARWARPWPAAHAAWEPGEVVIEAFGCELPPEVLATLASRARAPQGPPLWIDLEYLSAEPWVARSHGLPSPQFHGPSAGLTRWFYFPGFGPGTGGLLREPGLLRARAAFDRDAWLAARGLARSPGERVIVVFCYDDAPALGQLVAAFAAAAGPGPIRVLLTPGAAQRAWAGRFGGSPRSDGPDPSYGWHPSYGSDGSAVRVQVLPLLAQEEFDRLLWSADLATVRGEDSLVRAIWAGAPFLWQAYRQDDGVQATKVEAMLAALAAPPGLAAGLADAWRAWNAIPGPAGPAGSLVLPLLAPWGAAVRAWRERLAAGPDLATQLLDFARAHRPCAG
ncbi:MAG: elongation factor P maturation arginine rhamnosyltransferase EarP [Rubrivivax sp.]